MCFDDAMVHDQISDHRYGEPSKILIMHLFTGILFLFISFRFMLIEMVNKLYVVYMLIKIDTNC